MSAEFAVENLTVGGTSAKRLDSLSFSIDQGAWLSIVGTNGSGKSTLLKALAGITPSEGIIRYGDSRIDRLTPRARAARVAYVAQRYEPLVDFSVEQFLRLAQFTASAGRPDLEEVRSLFRLDSYWRRSIRALSVGEFQRVMLAAAFSQGSPVLLLDEPSAALDPAEECLMLDLLSTLNTERKKTILFVSHNLTAALTYADKVLALDRGRNTFFGTPDDFLSGQNAERIFQRSFFVERSDSQFTVVSHYGAGQRDE